MAKEAARFQDLIVIGSGKGILREPENTRKMQTGNCSIKISMSLIIPHPLHLPHPAKLCIGSSHITPSCLFFSSVLLGFGGRREIINGEV